MLRKYVRFYAHITLKFKVALHEKEFQLNHSLLYLISVFIILLLLIFKECYPSLLKN